MLTTLAGRLVCGIERCRKMKARREREEPSLTLSCTGLNPTQSRPVVGPWLLLSYVDIIKVHTPCVRYMEERTELHLSSHAVSIQQRRHQTDHHVTV